MNRYRGFKERRGYRIESNREGQVNTVSIRLTVKDFSIESVKTNDQIIDHSIEFHLGKSKPSFSEEPKLMVRIRYLKRSLLSRIYKVHFELKMCMSLGTMAVTPMVLRLEALTKIFTKQENVKSSSFSILYLRCSW
ncbi:hypothetical protein J6590_010431 [Homalodisca vitripennis]|nr:hypothetical protein J6590_010431 [Homalodisca vitripennis]